MQSTSLNLSTRHQLQQRQFTVQATHYDIAVISLLSFLFSLLSFFSLSSVFYFLSLFSLPLSLPPSVSLRLCLSPSRARSLASSLSPIILRAAARGRAEEHARRLSARAHTHTRARACTRTRRYPSSSICQGRACL